MQIRLLTTLVAFFIFSAARAQSPLVPVDSTQLLQAEIEKSLTYETGKIALGKDLATIDVPKGYKFLSAKQSQYVLNQLWGNPPDSSTMGMLFPADKGPFDKDMYAIEISYSEDGYIDD